jgi:hypothetical protein
MVSSGCQGTSRALNLSTCCYTLKDSLHPPRSLIMSNRQTRYPGSSWLPGTVLRLTITPEEASELLGKDVTDYRYRIYKIASDGTFRPIDTNLYTSSRHADQVCRDMQKEASVANGSSGRNLQSYDYTFDGSGPVHDSSTHRRGEGLDRRHSDYPTRSMQHGRPPLERTHRSEDLGYGTSITYRHVGAVGGSGNRKLKATSRGPRYSYHLKGCARRDCPGC